MLVNRRYIHLSSFGKNTMKIRWNKKFVGLWKPKKMMLWSPLIHMCDVWFFTLCSSYLLFLVPQENCASWLYYMLSLLLQLLCVSCRCLFVFFFFCCCFFFCLFVCFFTHLFFCLCLKKAVLRDCSIALVTSFRPPQAEKGSRYYRI